MDNRKHLPDSVFVEMLIFIARSTAINSKTTVVALIAIRIFRLSKKLSFSVPLNSLSLFCDATEIESRSY